MKLSKVLAILGILSMAFFKANAMEVELQSSPTENNRLLDVESRKALEDKEDISCIREIVFYGCLVTGIGLVVVTGLGSVLTLRYIIFGT